ncbi:MAG: YicC/YloC family endoribonuclease [Myxococcota bacterium]|nr:YicC/YloC family endoribonuclease [Myxococcota bacterium]
MRSMTGFGDGRAETPDFVVQVEIRSVNNRFCDVNFRGPRELASMEPELVRLVKQRFSRGRLDLSVRLETTAQTGSVVVDTGLAASYAQGVQELSASLGRGDEPISLEWIAGLPGVLRSVDRVLDPELQQQGVREALEGAMAGLDAMRVREGQALREDIEGHIAELEGLRQQAMEQVGDVVERYKARIEARLEGMQAEGLEPQRLAQELVLFADRADISEEFARLDAHLCQYRELLVEEAPIGRRLEFLAQELHREVNTMGSKAQEAALSSLVVEMKAVVERIREQAANVE